MAAKKIKRNAAGTRRKKRTSVSTEAKPVTAPAAVPYEIPEPKPVEGDTTSFIRRESERHDGDTAIRLYLREIGQVKLLTPDEEIQLAARIKKGDKKAREHMIKANLRLVVKIARDSQMRTASIRPASLDAPVGDDDSNNFSEIVEDERAVNPYDELEDKTVITMLQDMVKHLDEREATILRYRFGLDGGNEKTLEEVGEKFGVTRERIRQIQNLALRKLRKMIEKLEKEKKREE